MNRVMWDLRMEPLVRDGAGESLPPPGPVAPPQAPLVLPGVYAVSVRTSDRQLEGTITVAADPRVVFSDGDRRDRQRFLVGLYELEKSLVAARTAAADAVLHFDAAARSSHLVNPPQERLRQLQIEISTTLTTAASLFRSIEGFSGMPTTDQRRQIEWMFDDAGKAIDALNIALQTDGARPAQLVNLPKRP